MDGIMIKMLEIYKPLEIGYDWLNYKITRPRDLTFHHIKECRNKGKRTIDNGAILISRSHEYLNYLDRYYHEHYDELNWLFKELNKTMQPPTEDYYEEIDYVLKKVMK